MQIHGQLHLIHCTVFLNPWAVVLKYVPLFLKFQYPNDNIHTNRKNYVNFQKAL